MNFFSRFHKPSDSFWELFSANIKAFSFTKREIWVDVGEIPKHIAYIKSGAALAFEFNNNERKLTRIWSEGNLILNAEFALANKKSTHQILFPVDTIVYMISYKDLIMLRYNSDEMHSYVDYFIAEEIQTLISNNSTLRKSYTAISDIPIYFKFLYILINHSIWQGNFLKHHQYYLTKIYLLDRLSDV